MENGTKDTKKKEYFITKMEEDIMESLKITKDKEKAHYFI